MASHSQFRITALLLLIIQITNSQPAKSNSRPVHEIINEQARSDDKIRLGTQGNLPYGNPLAGNSQQNARLHAQNQQAMFNAERIRQHRAQLQRWTKAPPQVDSYMRAYQESQENHQLALEQQQGNLRDKKTGNAEAKPVTKPRTVTRTQTLKRGVKVIPEAAKLLKDNKEKSRNHRSYGSVEYHQYLEPKAYKTVYVSPGPTYDQGVTIKPNGNVGLAYFKPSPEMPKLFTEAIPSKTQYVYPKQYSQMQNYESAKDIEALNSLLKKTPQVQVSELNALLSPGATESKDVLDTPIDLYFYKKDPQTEGQSNHYDELYAQVPPTYASAYMPEVKDHVPITEEVDDIENPNKDPKVKPIGLQTVLAPQVPEAETTTTKSNNYYKVEVASQIISSGFKPSEVKQYVPAEENDHTPHSQPLVYYIKKGPKPEDLSQRYLHHNSQHQGVQHLSEDGTGTSAYGDDDVSITNSKARDKRSPGIEKLIPLTEKPNLKNNTPKAEPLVRIRPFYKKEIETFLTTPNFPIGVATDVNYDYDEPPRQRIRPNRGKVEFVYDDDEYKEYGDDFSSPEDDFGSTNLRQSPLYFDRPKHNYAPAMTYNHNVDLTTGFSNKYPQIKRFPQFPNNYRGLYGQSYGGGSFQPPATSYGVPQVYGQPLLGSESYGTPQYGVPSIPNLKNVLEPVYMLTETQLHNLVGHHNLHIQHLDVFQYPYGKYSRSKPKRRYPYRQRNAKRHIHKLHKLNIL